MKTKKMLISFLLVLSMLITLFPGYMVFASDNAGTWGANINWEFDPSTKVLTLTGTGEMEEYQNTRGEYPWNNYMNECSKLVIESGITSIARYAFQGFKMTEITIPSTVKVIDYGAFSNCENLTNVSLPEGVEELRSGMSGCTSLASITFPSTLRRIDQGWPFVGCSKDLSISISNENTYFVIEDNALYTSNYSSLLWVSPNATGTFTVNEDTRILYGGAFDSCSLLTQIVLNDQQNVIGGCFKGCSGLTTLTIPTGASISWDYNMFNGCSSLKHLYVFGDAPEYYSGLMFDGCPNDLTIHYYAMSYGWTTPTWNGINTEMVGTIVTCGTIENYSWAYDDTTNKLTISGTGAVDYVAWSYYKDTIKQVCVEEGIESIGSSECYSMFSYYPLLESVSLPDTLRYFRSNFYDDAALQSINIPKNIYYFGHSGDGFRGCVNLKSIIVDDECINYKVVDNALLQRYSLGNNEYVYDMLYYFGSSENVVVPDDVESISYHGWTFQNNTGLKTIYIPKSVKKIYGYAFYDIENLTVYYEGSEADWNAIAYDEWSDVRQNGIEDAIIIYNYSQADYENNIINKNILSIVLEYDNNANENEVRRGDEFSVDIVVLKNPGLVDMEMSIAYDTRYLSLVSVVDNGMYGKVVSNSSISTNPYKLIWYDDELQSDNTSTGSAATLKFKVLDTCPEGEYSISLISASAFNNDNKVVSVSTSDAKVNVIQFYYGDIDNDGTITVDDATLLLEYLVQESGKNIEYLSSADVDGIPNLSVNDAVVILRHIAGWSRYKTLPYHPQ